MLVFFGPSSCAVMQDEDSGVEVAITTITGQSCVVRLQATATVQEAKHSIESALPGFPVIEQQLLQGTAILPDDSRPFVEIAQQGLELLVLRQPRMNLKKFISEHGYTESDVPAYLDYLLREASRREEPNVCLEIICHPKFSRFEREEHRNNEKERASMLLSLLHQPLFPAFESLVQHEGFGQIPGMLDEAAVALHSAASAGLAQHCRCLLESPHFQAAASKKPGTSSTALHHAANAEVLRVLLDSPTLATALNEQDRFGCTVLHYVTTEEMCRMILSQTVLASEFVNKVDFSGQTALHCAKNAGISAALLEHGALCSLSVADNLGRTPLHTLARNAPALATLLRFSAAGSAGSGDGAEDGAEGADFDVNALDKRGRTALHYATSEEACALLFQAGFGAINALDDVGMSALHTAKNLGVVRAVVEHPKFLKLNAICDFGISQHSDSALSRAASLGDSPLVLELLRHPGHDLQSLQKAADFAQGCTETACQALLAARDLQLKHETKVEEQMASKSRCTLL